MGSNDVHSVRVDRDMFLYSTSSNAGLELPVVIKVPDSRYLEENKSASFECVVTPPADLRPGEFPLSWSRVGGLPVSASINNSTVVTGVSAWR